MLTSRAFVLVQCLLIHPLPSASLPSEPRSPPRLFFPQVHASPSKALSIAGRQRRAVPGGAEQGVGHAVHGRGGACGPAERDVHHVLAHQPHALGRVPQRAADGGGGGGHDGFDAWRFAHLSFADFLLAPPLCPQQEAKVLIMTTLLLFGGLGAFPVCSSAPPPRTCRLVLALLDLPED